MTDNEIREVAKKDFEQYWLVARLTFKDILSDEVKGFFEVFYKAGYLEGFRKKEESCR